MPARPTSPPSSGGPARTDGPAPAATLPRPSTRWFRHRAGRISGLALAGVALPLSLLGILATPAHGQAQGAKVTAGAQAPAALVAASDPMGAGTPGGAGVTPHGYLLANELHLKLGTAQSATHRPAVKARPRAAAPAGRRVVAPRPVAVSRRVVPRPVAVVHRPAVSTPAGRSLGVFVVTCYDLEGRTASGAPTSLATVAVDPRIIPLGTTIYVQGVGVRVAEDTGGAIIGHRLDIWEPSYSACLAWGVQSRAVTIAG
jgi:3D (Asp-Asp-Asp) domain-containing protein